MKILVVMCNYPFPPRTGSAIVAFNTLEFLSKNNQLDLISLQDFHATNSLTDFVKNIEVIERKKSNGFFKWLKYLFYLLQGIPPSISIYHSKTMKKKVKNKIISNNYDAVLLFEMSAMQYCPSICFNKLIVNIEDPQSIKISRMSKLPVWTSIQKIKLFLSAKLTELYERRNLHKAAKILVLSEADAKDMKSLYSYTNLEFIPYGVKQKKYQEIINYKNRNKVIVFSGSMYHPPNVDAALYFLNDIFPLVLLVHPTVKFQIVGAEPDSRIFKAAEKYGDKVEITGKVQCVDEFIKYAAVSVCPVRLKIGVQTKVLEALSWGTPVVSTNAGNNGVGGLPGIHLWIEDNAQAFASRVNSLLDGKDWCKLSIEGRNLIENRYNWNNSAAQTQLHLNNIAQQK